MEKRKEQVEVIEDFGRKGLCGILWNIVKIPLFLYFTILSSADHGK